MQKQVLLDKLLLHNSPPSRDCDSEILLFSGSAIPDYMKHVMASSEYCDIHPYSYSFGQN